ncbi:MAG: tetratricopeptide repeat protein [Planctomycetes bacterium]|nr:tetratricopeptide repeat protein [Planctomycetota bacterium]
MTAPRTFVPALCLALLASCEPQRSPNAYAAAEMASRAEDWPRAAELWYQAHLDEEPKRAETYLETARAMEHAGDPESACGLLDQALALFPYDKALLAAKGALLERCGFPRGAEAAFARLVAVDPNHPEGLAALGRLRLGLSLERGALEPLERLVTLGLADAEVHEELGYLRQLLGEPEVALRHYARSIELGCDDPEVLLTAARLALEPALGRERDTALQYALSWLTQLVDRYPQHTEGHHLRGVVLLELGRREEARAALLRAAETDPSHLPSLVLLARLCAEDGDHERAQVLAQRALALEHDPARRAELEALAQPR